MSGNVVFGGSFHLMVLLFMKEAFEIVLPGFVLPEV